MRTEQLKTQFENFGYVFVESFLSLSDINRIRSELERVKREVIPQMPPEHVFYEDKSDPSTLKQLQRLHQHDPFFADLIREGKFPDLARLLLGTDVVGKNLQFLDKPPHSNRPTPAHQDGFYFKLHPCEAITMWLALEPVDEENGCVRYIAGSHKCGLRPHTSTGTLGFSQGISDFPRQSDTVTELALPAKAGDLLVHHAMTIHRAEANRSQTRSRQALGFIYYSVEARQDIEAWEKYQSDLVKELAAKGMI